MGTCYVVLYSILLIDSDRINAGGDENAGRNRGVNRYVSCYIFVLYSVYFFFSLFFFSIVYSTPTGGLGRTQRDRCGRRSNTGRNRWAGNREEEVEGWAAGLRKGAGGGEEQGRARGSNGRAARQQRGGLR